MYKVFIYQTEHENVPLEKFIKKLQKKNKIKEVAAINYYINNLETLGFELNDQIPNAIKKLRDGIFELRPGGSRVLFFCYSNNEFILLNGFEKKSNRTPKKEIELAIKYKKDHVKRNKI